MCQQINANYSFISQKSLQVFPSTPLPTPLLTTTTHLEIEMKPHGIMGNQHYYYHQFEQI